MSYFPDIKETPRSDLEALEMSLPHWIEMRAFALVGKFPENFTEHDYKDIKCACCVRFTTHGYSPACRLCPLGGPPLSTPNGGICCHGNWKQFYIAMQELNYGDAHAAADAICKLIESKIREAKDAE